MFKKIKRNILKMFRELLVYHNKSLEFRAKTLTLVIALDDKINPCEENILNRVAHDTYPNDDGRADLLIDTVYEYFAKIQTNNGLNYAHLISNVEKDIKDHRRYSKKIDMDILKLFGECLEDEDDKIFHQRMLDFLKNLKEEYGTV